MSESHHATAALQAFDHVVQAAGDFRSRPGQRLMAERVAHTFAEATLGKVDDDGDEPLRAIAVVQAGTGVGKSLAYCAPAIAMAIARKTRVLISTATVALQEQLVTKDLPALAALMPEPFRFGLAKGRGRYVCKLKLARQAGTGEGGAGEDDDLFADELPVGGMAGVRHDEEARQAFYAGMVRDLAGNTWDGDRDSLALQPEADWWMPVAAEASSCTGKHCPVFNGCTYFEKRKELVGAQVIVANHDLLLATLGTRTLPDLDNCLLVLDEAHHLPAVALDKFSCAMDLSRLGWIETLAGRAKRIGGLMQVSEAADVGRQAAQLKQSLQDVAALVHELYAGVLAEPRPGGWGGQAQGPARVRLPQGQLPAELEEPLQMVGIMAEGFLAVLNAISKALRTEMRDSPNEARRLSVLYAQLGTLSPRLEGVHATVQLLLKEATPPSAPVAKWFTLQENGGGGTGAGAVNIKAFASPILPGTPLRSQLWSKVRAAIVTSATLTSCGEFDFYLREAGLSDDEAVTTLEVASPFDYATQGQFVTVETLADPRHAGSFTTEMVQMLLRDAAKVKHGALALFTSRDQMRQAVQALTPVLRAVVLVQGELPRTLLLQRHRERVLQGGPSIIFGMQSFGEGLDLPGTLCETVFIAKLPFASPDDPVGESRAEWLRSVGRDPFTELVVPATAIRLAQWAGRAIRTETDKSFVYCYDRRLSGTSYGQRLMQGLPPFLRLRKDARGQMTPA
ncbi:ATP-dependent DNA helicase DinG [Rhodoferax koreense]|uniref:ATP-dependent DNA helicase DinG n=1 Tax=Rhodoferax koreensis TaxID=1842727 RepID=A0A1P8JXM2_9BURK|nr:ATP-dependent DNA helicase DinG [Rhodoferax koreense]APW38503.1 ATP-dependent DNA helicase DinG [Rhodoferax koreense]